MNAPTTCPCCGVVVMPPQLSYDFDGETVASLTREVAYLRATVARLRGAPTPRASVAPAPRAWVDGIHQARHGHAHHEHGGAELSVVAPAS